MSEEGAQPKPHEMSMLLNHMVSTVVTRAPQEHQPDRHSGAELLDVIWRRFRDGVAMEMFNGPLDGTEEQTKDASDILFVRDMKFLERRSATFVAILLDHLDKEAKAFPVVSRATLAGRSLTGSADEVGSSQRHVIIRLPSTGTFDDGVYRCVIEPVPPVSRKLIETFLYRQLKKHYGEKGIEFEVQRIGRRGRPVKSLRYKYHPKLELRADVARSLGGYDLVGGPEPTRFEFTKRKEERLTGTAVHVIERDFVSDIQVKVSAKEAPTDPEERRRFFGELRRMYEEAGYTTKVYFRHLRSNNLRGAIKEDQERAADLILCPRQSIFVKRRPEWRKTVNEEIADQAVALLEEDAVWERIK